MDHANDLSKLKMFLFFLLDFAWSERREARMRLKSSRCTGYVSRKIPPQSLEIQTLPIYLNIWAFRTLLWKSSRKFDLVYLPKNVF